MNLRNILKQKLIESIEKNQNEILKSSEKNISAKAAIATNKQTFVDHKPSVVHGEQTEDIQPDNPLLTQGIDALVTAFTNEKTEKLDEDNYEGFQYKKKLQRGKSYTFIPRQSKANKKAIQKANKSFKGRTINIKIEKKANLIRQLSILLESGMDLRSSLAILEEQEVNNKNIWYFIHFLFVKIESGESLSDALLVSPVKFNESEIAMVRAGEATGRQAETLSQMASLIEKKVKIKKKITSAMVYPCTLFVVSSIVVLLLTTVVVPKFEKVIADQIGKDKMPALTAWIVKASQFVSDHLSELFWILVAVVIMVILAKTVSPIKGAIHKALIKIPMLGTCITTWSIVLFSRTFGDLLVCGCSIIESLKMATESVANYLMKKSLLSSIHDVQQGLSLSESLRRREVFPAMAEGLIKVGEESGKLGQMMGVIAANYEEILDENITRLTALIEPLLVIGLSFFVGTIVIGLFLPIIALIQNIAA